MGAHERSPVGPDVDPPLPPDIPGPGPTPLAQFAPAVRSFRCGLCDSEFTGIEQRLTAFSAAHYAICPRALAGAAADELLELLDEWEARCVTLNGTPNQLIPRTMAVLVRAGRRENSDR